MTQFSDLRVFNEARRNIRSIASLCNCIDAFGDLSNQLKRSAVSVVSNIAEGMGSTTKRQVLKLLGIARASNNELYAQVLIVSDLQSELATDEIVQNIQYVGKMLTKLIQHLRNCSSQ